MRIDVRSEGFQLTPQQRGVVVSRLLSALGPFGVHIQLVVVGLRAITGHTQADTMVCDVGVTFVRLVTFALVPKTRRCMSRLTAPRSMFAVQSNAKCRDCKRHLARLMLRRLNPTRSNSCWTATRSHSSSVSGSRGRRTTCGPFAYGSIGGPRGLKMTKCRKNWSPPWRRHGNSFEPNP
jgi:hypothetical protein